jgi:adenosylmethionine-8-amino-7-oxononanoate aminotransferase
MRMSGHGLGRTGEWFGSFTYGIQPDILTMAKGLSSGYQPIRRSRWRAAWARPLPGATRSWCTVHYSGHPVASAVALKNLEVLERKRIVQRVKRTIGPYFQRRVRQVFEDHPLVGEVRGVGCWRRSSWSRTRRRGGASRASGTWGRSAATTASRTAS